MYIPGYLQKQMCLYHYPQIFRRETLEPSFFIRDYKDDVLNYRICSSPKEKTTKKIHKDTILYFYL